MSGLGEDLLFGSGANFFALNTIFLGDGTALTTKQVSYNKGGDDFPNLRFNPAGANALEFSDDGLTWKPVVDLAAQYDKAYIDANLLDKSNSYSKAQIDSAIASLASGGVAVGAIVLWSGPLNEIPEGYHVCDGTTGTPDLRDRFVVGAGLTYAVGDIGGSFTHSTDTVNTGTHIVSLSTSGDHSHTITVSSHISHSHTGSSGNTALTLAQNAWHQHRSLNAFGGPEGAFVKRVAFGLDNSDFGQIYPNWYPDDPFGYYSFPHYTYIGGSQPHSHGFPSDSWGSQHSASASSDGSHSHIGTSDSPTHSHNITNGPPPYYALAYIQYIG